MSACIYYRKGLCKNAAKCQYKILAKDGKILCRRDGDIPDADKSSARYRKED